ncbi:MAG TPA: type II toxin-antitoxin system VapC family toxin [Gaiellaceae bacterium]|nr:type II toxin-antitoxin system VapC family toxin [Gaiellaceae bacterium]
MTEAVLDASVVIKWFRSEGERHVDDARALRSSFEAGELIVFTPPLLRLEIVNVAGRRWSWDEAALVDLAGALDDLGFEQIEPDLVRVARWTARGLTAHDGAYVAVAEAIGARLITDDELIAEIAEDIAHPLAEIRS